MAKTKLNENFVAEQIRQIIEKLGVSATIEVSGEGESFFVDIASDDSALLIGKHGINLESLQFALAVRLKSQTGQDDFEVYVDVNNWRRSREEKLKTMARQIAETVQETGVSQPIYNLRSSERRVIHMELTNHPGVATVSEGEGVDRHLVVKLK